MSNKEMIEALREAEKALINQEIIKLIQNYERGFISVEEVAEYIIKNHIRI